MFSLTQYLQTLEHPEGLCRSLTGFRLCRHADGAPIYHCGNSAILFKIELNGRAMCLRCYTRPMPPKRELLYGEDLRPQELYIYQNNQTGCWVDVVVREWIEGITLDEALQQALRQNALRELHHLSEAFDRLSARLVCDAWAHGDLKPENILVDQEGALRLIDFDGAFLPEFTGMSSPELGTTAFQHPDRTTAQFDRTLDHFSAALISVQLRALALQPDLYTRFHPMEGILFSAEELAGSCPAYDALLQLFSQRCDYIHYALCLQLRQPTHQLQAVERLFNHISPILPMRGEIELFIEMGRCGFRQGEVILVPPLFDEAFDFREGWASVRLGACWHYIDRYGRRIWTPPACEALKSIRNGCARYRIDGQWHEEKVK